jgi:ribosomal protein S18 acetylase RimI-like enzyme
MTLFENFSLMRECFPDSWVRKLPLLLFPADAIRRGGKVVALCTTFNKRIILLCVHPRYRLKGLASRLIKQSDATVTDTYLGNDAALKMWRKNGFRVEKVEDTLFGKRYLLVRRGR